MTVWISSLRPDPSLEADFNPALLASDLSGMAQTGFPAGNRQEGPVSSPTPAGNLGESDPKTLGAEARRKG